MARAACRQSRKRFRILCRAVRMDQGGGHGYGPDGHLPAGSDRRRAGRRHDEQDQGDADAVLAVLLQRRQHRRRRQARDRSWRPDPVWAGRSPGRKLDRPMPRSAGRYLGPPGAAPMITVSAFKWVPPFAQGLVRDLRVRWALEEAGLAYQTRLLDQGDQDKPEYRALQPFGQVPILEEDGKVLFETGAIVLHIGERSAAL